MTRYALLLLILSIAGFLRLYRFTTIPPGLYRDEAMNGSNALEVLETGRFQVFYPENGGREGLYINVATVFISVCGNKAWVLRLPAAIFGILTVWGVYLLVAELASVETALLAAFFLATCFWHIDFSRIAFRAIAA
ncbi:MAG TPA: glycosyltransferase family 39 protein, partial [Bryobacteraceae bacterium]|nr:glycosyltransferase family 39 protein [Bryobacteraceae bacterium]